MHAATTSRSAKRAFTLVEVMIASTIAALVIAGTTALLISGMRYYNYGRYKLLISSDMRGFTHELMTAGRNASSFKIYNDFASRTDQGATGAGDMVAFLYADPDNEAQVVRVIWFYRDLGKANTATTKDQSLRKYDTGYQAASAFGPSWMPPTASRTSNKAIVDTTADRTKTQALMFQGVPYGPSDLGAVAISGQIVYENKALRRFQNNYDFVVACRS